MKKSVKVIFSVLLVLCMSLGFVGCGGGPEKAYVSPLKHKTSYDTASDTLYVDKVDGIGSDFVMGMDASIVPALEASGVKYYDYDGKETDVFKTFADYGINTIRVRVWNDPYTADGKSYGGGNNDINTAVEIGKRATKYGMNLMVDFHYSDFWADPSKQQVPKAWANMAFDEKETALYEYTKDCLNKLNQAKVAVSIVQVGNETNGKLCGETKWNTITRLMQAGSDAVREVMPEAMVAVHFANPESTDNYRNYAEKLKSFAVDYDIFASSYYPYWHGTLDNLSSILGEISEKYGKKVMVAETSYAYTPDDTDFNGNTIGEGSLVTKDYPYTVQGQANSVRNVIEAVAKTKGGMGVCYWEGAWITVGTTSWEENSAKWEQYGSGWASQAAGEYDPNDAGKYYGGSAVDNQAFFDAEGKPLESLKVFSLVRTGNKLDAVVDAVEDYTLLSIIGKDVNMPEKVNVIMTDNSRKAEPVTWNVSREKLEEMKNGGVQKYTIEGTCGGMKATCYVSIIEANYLTNYSFEDGETGWTAHQNVKAEQLYVEDKLTDSLTGDKHYHFWAGGSNRVDFTVEQTVANLPAGKYKYSISIMGGDGGTMEIYAYVKINGEIVKTAPMTMTVYGEWDTAWIKGIEYDGNGTFTVGIAVKCSGSNAWGKIDDALLNDDED